MSRPRVPHTLTRHFSLRRRRAVPILAAAAARSPFLLLAAAAVPGLSPTLAADTHTWLGPDGGAWTTGTWSPAGAPAAGDSALLSLAPAAPYSITFDGSYTAGAGRMTAVTLDSSTAYDLTLVQDSASSSLHATNEYVGHTGRAAYAHSAGTHAVSTYLHLGTAAGSTGTYSLSGSAASLSTGVAFVGNSGAGTFLHSAGTHAVTKTLYLGNAAGSTGTYSLSGTGSLAAGNAFVGHSGAGTLVHSAGTHSIAGELSIGAWPGSTGTYSLSGSGSLSSYYTAVGYSGAGTFAHSAGTHAASGLYLGYYAGSTGTYSLSGTGSLSVSYAVNAFTGNVYVGHSGAGTFLHSAGTHTIPKALHLGYSAGSTGTYNLSGTTAALSAVTAFVGTSGAGTFLHSAGRHAVSGDLSLGSGAGSTGTYSLSGADAALSTRWTSVGTYGSGTFVHSAGTHSIADHLLLGRYAGGTGTYSLSGSGSLSIGGSADVGGDGSSPGAGLLSISGGSAAVAGTLTVYDTPGSSVALAGGTLAVGTLAGPGPVAVTGGTLTASRLDGPALSVAALGAADVAVVRLTPGSPGASRLASLGITAVPGGSALLDLADNDLILDYAAADASPADDVLAHLLAGRNAGGWDGAVGIVSAAAAADPQRLATLAYAEAADLLGLAGADTATWNGQTVDATTLLLKHTYYGDANLDGLVNADDYVLLDRGFALSSLHWRDGDFDYSGSVTPDDYLLIDRTFVLQGAPLSPDFLSQREARFGPAYVSTLLAAVPEPSSLSSILYPLSSILARRRRRRPSLPHSSFIPHPSSFAPTSPSRTSTSPAAARTSA